MRLIELHKEWMEEWYLGCSGLCSAVPKQYDDSFNLLSPTKEEVSIHVKEGYGSAWWGETKEEAEYFGLYTPLRQTIVLLICAMNNEL